MSLAGISSQKDIQVIYCNDLETNLINGATYPPTSSSFEQLNRTFESVGQPNLTVSVRGYRVNNIITITLTFAAQTITTVGASVKDWSDTLGTIPAEFQSSSGSIYAPLTITNGGINQNAGFCGILTGNILIQLPASLAAGATTFYDCSFSYLVI